MDDKSNELKTNEQIIDELTKELENSCIKVDDECGGASMDNVAEPTKVNVNVLSDSSGDYVKTKGDNSGKCSTESEHETNRPNDFVDEEALKDRDLALSESEKENLKNESERYKNRGNDLFKNGEYVEAISMYTQGIQTCPLAYRKERSILYANRAAAKSKCLDKESAISDCAKAIELNDGYVKAYIRRAQLYEETEKLDEALEDYKKVLTFDPSHTEANLAVRRLPPMIHQRNEQLKTEMLGKLKDLGNVVLKPFGLSTNNFELQKDSNSGGYTVKFRQNPNE